MKYIRTETVEAEQFLPEEDKIPDSVFSDGPRSPKIDQRAAWMVKTTNGSKYLHSGEWIVTFQNGNCDVLTDEEFKAAYKEG